MTHIPTTPKAEEHGVKPASASEAAGTDKSTRSSLHQAEELCASLRTAGQAARTLVMTLRRERRRSRLVRSTLDSLKQLERLAA